MATFTTLVENRMRAKQWSVTDLARAVAARRRKRYYKGLSGFTQKIIAGERALPLRQVPFWMAALDVTPGSSEAQEFTEALDLHNGSRSARARPALARTAQTSTDLAACLAKNQELESELVRLTVELAQARAAAKS